MRRLFLFPRFFGLWLILSLALPNPAFALRQTEAKQSGVEEKLTTALHNIPLTASVRATVPAASYPAPAAGAEEVRRKIQRALDAPLSMQAFQVRVKGEASRGAGAWVRYRGIGGFVPNRLLLHPSGIPLKTEERRDWLNKHVGESVPAYPVEIADEAHHRTLHPLFFGLLVSEEPSAQTLRIRTLRDVVTLPGAFHILMEAAKGGDRPAKFLSGLWNRGLDPRPMVIQWRSDLGGWESLMQRHRKVIVHWMVEHLASSGELDLFEFFRSVALPDREGRWSDFMGTRILAAQGMQQLLNAEKDGNRRKQMEEDYAQVIFQLDRQSGQSWVNELERKELDKLFQEYPPAAGAEEIGTPAAGLAALEAYVKQPDVAGTIRLLAESGKTGDVTDDFPALRKLAKDAGFERGIAEIVKTTATGGGVVGMPVEFAAQGIPIYVQGRWLDQVKESLRTLKTEKAIRFEPDPEKAFVVIGDDSVFVRPSQMGIRVNNQTVSRVTPQLLQELQRLDLLKAGSVVTLYQASKDSVLIFA